MSVPGELEGSVRDNFYRRQNPSLSLCIFNSFCPQSTFVPVQVKVFLVAEKKFSFFSRRLFNSLRSCTDYGNLHCTMKTSRKLKKDYLETFNFAFMVLIPVCNILSRSRTSTFVPINKLFTKVRGLNNEIRLKYALFHFKLCEHSSINSHLLFKLRIAIVSSHRKRSPCLQLKRFYGSLLSPDF